MLDTINGALAQLAEAGDLKSLQVSVRSRGAPPCTTAQAIEARRVETLGSVEDKSAVATPCATLNPTGEKA